MRRAENSPNLEVCKHGGEPSGGLGEGQPAGLGKRLGHSPCHRLPDKITAMNGVILVLLAITLAVVVIVLLTGVVGMARGGDFNAKYGNKLMRVRVVLQGLAVVLFVLMFVTADRG